MADLLNTNRPPIFCPGCSHDKMVRILDKTFQAMGLKGEDIVICTDIGCSGLFDTFFNTHALHGLHGRALTYATGIKMARPELTVVATMGDGGLGIGGAHFLAACRRNADLTLIVLNNFNYAMTGGQFSFTTPAEAHVESAFLNTLEPPLDPCAIAKAAGATFAARCSTYQEDLSGIIEQAIRHTGFSVVDVWGICPGRYIKRNTLTPKIIAEQLAALPPANGVIPENARAAYGDSYRKRAAEQPQSAPPVDIQKRCAAPFEGRKDVLVLGNAGQRIVTAGELLCLAGLTAGLNVTQKNEYNITVLRGPSIAEVILSDAEIGYTGITQPSVILAIGQDGVKRRDGMWGALDSATLILKAPGIEVPSSQANVIEIDFGETNIKPREWALASLAILAGRGILLSQEMLQAAIDIKFTDHSIRAETHEFVRRIQADM